MHHITTHLALLAALSLSGSAVAQVTTFRVSLDGTQVNPINLSAGTGTAIVTLNTATGVVTVTGTYTGLGSNRSAQHIHAALPGLNGGVKIPMTATGTTSGTLGGGGTLLAPDIATMLSGGMYINIHSFAFPLGEIRGQIGACILYYKFDRKLGNVRVNYGDGGAPAFGTIAGAAAPNTAPGKFGAALRGSSNTSCAHCYTGWKGPVQGSVSISWWVKERQNPGTTPSYMWGGIGNFQCFTNGLAGTGIWVRGWGGPDLKYPGNFQASSRAAGGVCIGLVIDAAKKRAQWYTNGAATGAAIVIPNGVNVPAYRSGFRIGVHAFCAFSSAYDTDEFKLCNRAISAAEMKAWCDNPWAACGQLGKPCGIVHGCDGGVPKLGNAFYRLTARGPANMRYLLILGATEVPGFDMGVAFGNLSGCNLYTQFALEIFGTTGANGLVTVNVPIPNLARLAGLGVDSQVFGQVGTTGPVLMSNHNSTKIEKN